jgi:hypothetical protein
MTLKEFVSSFDIKYFEIIPSFTIMNIVTNDDICYSIDNDFSNIPGGTVLVKVEQWNISEDILIVDGLGLDMNSTNVLGFDDKLPFDIISEQ